MIEDRLSALPKCRAEMIYVAALPHSSSPSMRKTPSCVTAAIRREIILSLKRWRRRTWPAMGTCFSRSIQNLRQGSQRSADKPSTASWEPSRRQAYPDNCRERRHSIQQRCAKEAKFDRCDAQRLASRYGRVCARPCSSELSKMLNQQFSKEPAPSPAPIASTGVPASEFDHSDKRARIEL
jgi:hypothetical protein